MNDPEASVEHFASMQMSASGLAKKYIAIYEHEFAMLTFGCFTAVVGTRHKRWRFIWDGKDGVMTVSFAVVSDSQDRPEWTTVLSEYLSSAPYDFIRDYDYEIA